MSQLFPDQIQALADYRAACSDGYRAPILLAATGWGKTRTAAHLIREITNDGGRVWFLAHLGELLQDTADRLRQQDVRFGWIWGNRPQDLAAGCQLVSVASAASAARIADLGPPPDLVVVDECHRTTGSYDRVFEALGHPPRLGLTGTPMRNDGRSMRACGYDHLVRTLDTIDLVAAGRLSPLRSWSFPPPAGALELRDTRQDQAAAGELMSSRRLMGDALEHWVEICERRPCAIFTSGVRAARETAELWRRAGFRALAVDGKTPDSERREAVERARAGCLDALVSADLYVAGLDWEDMGAVICNRITDSLIIWLQMVGRGLRRSDVFPDCYLLDHAGNMRRPGLGDPMARRMHLWSLDRGGAGRHREAIPPVRVCERCYSTAMAGNRCEECGHVRRPPTIREAVLLPGHLVEVSSREEEARRLEEARRQRRLEESRCRTMADWVALGQSREYSDPLGWARVRHGHRQRRQPVGRARRMEA